MQVVSFRPTRGTLAIRTIVRTHGKPASKTGEDRSTGTASIPRTRHNATRQRARSKVLPGQQDKENERLPHAGFPLRNVAGRTGRAMDVTQSHRHARHNSEAVRVPSTPCIRNHAPCSHKSTGPRCAGHARFAGPEDPSGPGCWATFLTCPGC